MFDGKIKWKKSKKYSVKNKILYRGKSVNKISVLAIDLGVESGRVIKMDFDGVKFYLLPNIFYFFSILFFPSIILFLK